MTTADDWPRCREWLLPLMEASDLYDIEYIESAIQSGSMHLWAGKNCALVTEFMHFPKCKVLNVFAGAGIKGKSLREMICEMEPRLVEWAKENECSQIMGHGIFEGWRTVTEKMGYHHHHTVMIKAI